MNFIAPRVPYLRSRFASPSTRPSTLLALLFIITISLNINFGANATMCLATCSPGSSAITCFDETVGPSPPAVTYFTSPYGCVDACISRSSSGLRIGFSFANFSSHTDGIIDFASQTTFNVVQPRGAVEIDCALRPDGSQFIVVARSGSFANQTFAHEFVYDIGSNFYGFSDPSDTPFLTLPPTKKSVVVVATDAFACSAFGAGNEGTELRCRKETDVVPSLSRYNSAGDPISLARSANPLSNFSAITGNFQTPCIGWFLSWTTHYSTVPSLNCGTFVAKDTVARVSLNEQVLCAAAGGDSGYTLACYNLTTGGNQLLWTGQDPTEFVDIAFSSDSTLACMGFTSSAVVLYRCFNISGSPGSWIGVTNGSAYGASTSGPSRGIKVVFHPTAHLMCAVQWGASMYIICLNVETQILGVTSGSVLTSIPSGDVAFSIADGNIVCTIITDPTLILTANCHCIINLTDPGYPANTCSQFTLTNTNLAAVVSVKFTLFSALNLIPLAFVVPSPVPTPTPTPTPIPTSIPTPAFEPSFAPSPSTGIPSPSRSLIESPVLGCRALTTDSPLAGLNCSNGIWVVPTLNLTVNLIASNTAISINGTLDVDSSVVTLSNGSGLTVGGNLYLQSQTSQAILIVNQSSLQVQGNLTVAGSTGVLVTANTSPIFVTGNVVLSPTSSVTYEVGSNASRAALVVGGCATLDGNLTLNVFDPTLTQVVVIEATNCSQGNFASVSVKPSGPLSECTSVSDINPSEFQGLYVVTFNLMDQCSGAQVTSTLNALALSLSMILLLSLPS